MFEDNIEDCVLKNTFITRLISIQVSELLIQPLSLKLAPFDYNHPADLEDSKHPPRFPDEQTPQS